MFHFKKITIITAALFALALIFICLVNISPILVFIALGLLSAGFGCLTYILIDEYIVYNKIQNETKHELLMELATSENAEEYIANSEFFNKGDLKRIKAQKRSKRSTIILSLVLCLAFLLLFVLRLF